MAKHLGRDMAGDQLVVSYMLMPESQNKALVTRVNRLHRNIQRALMSLVGSPDAQSSLHLAEVLGRRMFEDTGKSFFQVLHEMKALEAISIDDVVMTPSSNTSYPLRMVLEGMGVIAAPVTEARQGEQGFNRFVNNQQAEETEESLGIARNLLIEAQMLEDDAARKREQAYTHAPTLRPTPITPPMAAVAALPEAFEEALKADEEADDEARDAGDDQGDDGTD